MLQIFRIVYTSFTKDDFVSEIASQELRKPLLTKVNKVKQPHNAAIISNKKKASRSFLEVVIYQLKA